MSRIIHHPKHDMAPTSRYIVGWRLAWFYPEGTIIESRGVRWGKVNELYSLSYGWWRQLESIPEATGDSRAEFIIANKIPFTDTQLDPLEALNDALSFDSRDWGQTRGDAWIYGIISGWGDALPVVAARHGWDERAVLRLRLLHLAFRRTQAHTEADHG